MAGKEIIKNFSESMLDEICEEDQDKVLNEIAYYTGWIVILLNSLEETVSFCIKELLASSEAEDELIYIFLSEMHYSNKVNLLIKIYGQHLSRIERLDVIKEDYQKLENVLKEAGNRRNRYAHADWIGISKERYVKVKTKAKKDGVFHTFRKFDEEDMKCDLEFIEAAVDLLEEFDEKFREIVYHSG